MVPFTMEYVPERHYIRVHVKAVLNNEVLYNLAAALLESVEQNGCTRVLGDIREAQVWEALPEIEAFAGAVEETGLDHRFKMAAVYARDAATHRYFEMLVRKQGYNFRHFDNIEAAEAWLLRD